MTRFAIVAAGVLAGLVFLALVAPVRLAAAVDCENWNTEVFFETATPATVHECLDEGADPNARTMRRISGRFLFYIDDFTPLHWAAMSADTAVIKVLLGAGANPKAQDEKGRTPLHEAAWRNRDPAVISALLDAGADLEVRTKDGRTPLHMATENKIAVIKVLLEAGADPKARDEGGKTPLHVAARHNPDPTVTSALLDAGADLEVRDNYFGFTPLHLV